MELAQIEAYIGEQVAQSEEIDTFRAPLVAVSAAHDPRYEALKTIIGPHHALPAEHIPGAQTVISFFIPFTARVVAANRREQAVSEVWASTYVLCNRLINRISGGLVALLESSGHQAATIAATHTYDPRTLLATWSHKSAACIAGLGEFGRNHLIITENGCAGRFGTVFTDLVLPAAQVQSPQRCLSFLGGECDFCVTNCPARAFDADRLDKRACHTQLLATNDRFPNLDKCDSCGKCAMGPCAYFQ